MHAAGVRDLELGADAVHTGHQHGFLQLAEVGAKESAEGSQLAQTSRGARLSDVGLDAVYQRFACVDVYAGLFIVSHCSSSRVAKNHIISEEMVELSHLNRYRYRYSVSISESDSVSSRWDRGIAAHQLGASPPARIESRLWR